MGLSRVWPSGIRRPHGTASRTRLSLRTRRAGDRNVSRERGGPMAEQAESTETAEEPETAGAAAKQEVPNLRHEMSRERLDERAENAVESVPILRYLLEWKVVGIAVAIAAVLTLITVLLMS